MREVITITATQLKNEILKANGGSPLIKIGKICEIIGDTDRHRVKQTYLQGLQKIGSCYFVPEVAERLKERATLD